MTWMSAVGPNSFLKSQRCWAVMLAGLCENTLQDLAD